MARDFQQISNNYGPVMMMIVFPYPGKTGSHAHVFDRRAKKKKKKKKVNEDLPRLRFSMKVIRRRQLRRGVV